MCSIRSGVGSTHGRLDRLSVTGPFVKLQGYLGGQTVKLEFEERGLMMGESTLSKGPITRAGSGGLAQMRFVATEGPTWLVGSGITYPACCPTALLMSGTRISTRRDGRSKCCSCSVWKRLRRQAGGCEYQPNG
jgi:hypothetical protein